jgi:multicomponent Na+:H+ antiporter subunit E
VALFAFWFMLSGRTDPEHLIIGAASSVGIAVIYRPLVLFRWRGRPRQETHPFWELPWLRLLGYLPYLSWEIIRANIQVAILILSPRLPIQPSMVEFEKRLPGPVAQLILAHSITLTPGTVTVDVVGDRFLIHALWEKAARGLVPEGREGEMPTRVGALFGLNPEWSAGGPGQADDAAPACGGGSRS